MKKTQKVYFQQLMDFPHQFIGTLSVEQSQYFFQYDNDYLTLPKAIPLSLSLPLQKESFANKETRAFFANLLPDSTARTQTAKRLGISSKNDFALLEAIGGECAGAVSLLPADEIDGQHDDYRLLDVKALEQCINELGISPLAVGQSGVRLSLAGAQDKLPVYLDKGKYYLPLGSNISSHIIKPGIEGVDGIIANEAFCMRLAAHASLNVPTIEVVENNVSFYQIERYDRTRDEQGNFKRIHQEDFCQALSIMPEYKYQREGGPSLAQCFTLLREYSVQPVADIQRLLEWVR